MPFDTISLPVRGDHLDPKGNAHSIRIGEVWITPDIARQIMQIANRATDSLEQEFRRQGFESACLAMLLNEALVKLKALNPKKGCRPPDHLIKRIEEALAKKYPPEKWKGVERGI